MGSAFAQFIEWNYKQQLDWNLLDYPIHGSIRRYVRDLGRVYESAPALCRLDDTWDGFAVAQRGRLRPAARWPSCACPAART